MREIDGSDERRERGKEREREREVRAEDVEIKRGTKEDCEGERDEGKGGGELSGCTYTR